MPGLFPILTHADDAHERLAQMYRDKPILEGILAAVCAEVQEIENAIWQLASERGIVLLYLDGDPQFSEAVGHQLDVVGKIFRQTRGAMTDAEYRLALRAKIRVLKSSGTVEELIAVFFCVEPDALITVTTWPPAYVTVELSDVIEHWKSDLYRSFLRQARAGGVAGTLLWQEIEDAHSLILSDAADCPVGAPYLEIDTDTGLGDATDPDVGGALSGAAG